MITTMDWTDEAVAQLRQLWAEGHSTAEIGRRIGVSKNAVVGKAHRLKLEPRPSPIQCRSERKALHLSQPLPQPCLTDLPQPPSRPTPPPHIGAATKKPSKPQPSAPQRPLPTEAKPPPVVKTPIPPCIGKHACCWPIGEPGTKGFQFCDAPALAGKPYCEPHAARAYQPKTARPDRPAAAA